MKVHKSKLRYFKMRPIEARHSTVPTLYLDATANEEVIRNVIGHVDFQSVSVKQKKDINVYQSQDLNITKRWLTDKENQKKLIMFLKKCKDRYKNVGVITYKNIPEIRDFDKWLGEETGVSLTGHFGDIRGRDEFANVNCLVIAGRQMMNRDSLWDHAHAVFGEEVSVAKKDSQDILNVTFRMKDGSAMQLANRVFKDRRLEAVHKHFNQSETIQAIGRGRLIWGKAKIIYVLTKETMGDVEIKEFISENDIFPDGKYDPAISMLKEKGACRNTPRELEGLGLEKSWVKNNRKDIISAFETAGFPLRAVRYKTKQRKIVEHEFFAKSKEELDTYINENRGHVV